MRLRALRLTDFNDVHTLLSDWNIVRYMSLPHCKTEEESRKCIEDLIGETPGDPWKSVVRAIERLESGAVIGLCGIAILHGSEQAELWYLVRPDHWGHGIAYRAARQLLQIGFSELHLHRIWATCLPDNPASARVLEKLGMRKEAFQLKNLKAHGIWHDNFLYAILREEWEIIAASSVTTTPSPAVKLSAE